MRTSLISIGLFLIFLGFIIVFYRIIDSKVKVVAGGFIGLIPFGFASDKQTHYALLAFMIIFLIIWFILTKLN